MPAWRPVNASWRDLGGLVALRLERAAAILVGGHVRFFCWGSAAHCRECTGDPTSYRAWSSHRGRYHNDTLVALQHGRAPKPGDREKCRLGRRP